MKKDARSVMLINPHGADALFDPSSNAQINVSHQHHEIHEGHTFSVAAYDDALADDDFIEFVFTVGTPKEAHLVYGAVCGGDGVLSFYEDPTTVSGGSELTERNKNRIIGDAGNQVSVLQDPASIGGNGTLLEQFVIPGGTGGNATGGTVTQRAEWILRPDKLYLLRITNIAGLAKPVSLKAEWYEHTPEN